MTEITNDHIAKFMNDGMYYAGRTAEFKSAPLPIDVNEMYLEYVSLSLADAVGTKVNSVDGYMFRLFKNAFKMAVRFCRAEKRGITLYVKDERTDDNLLQFGSVGGGEGYDEIVHHDEVRGSVSDYPIQKMFEALREHFSPKDLSIIDLMLAGSKQSEIADDLQIGLRSVERTMAKLRAFGYTKPSTKQHEVQSLPKQTIEAFYIQEREERDSWANAKLILQNDVESGGF